LTPLWRAEGADRVRYRLDTGQRRAAVRKRPEQSQDERERDDARGAGPDLIMVGQGVRVSPVQAAQGLTDQADHDHQDDRAGEQVGGHREDAPGFLDPAQVPVAHEQDHADRDLQVPRAERGERGDHSGGAGRDLHRHRDDVIDEQGHGGDLRDLGTEVLPGHHVGAARADVDHHHFAVGQHHQDHHHEDDQRDREDDGESGEPGQRQQRDQDLLRAVGGGRDPVGGEHTQGQRFRQALVAKLLVDHGRPEQAAFHRIPEALFVQFAPAEKAGCLAYRHVGASRRSRMPVVAFIPSFARV